MIIKGWQKTLCGKLGWASCWKYGKSKMILTGSQWIGDGLQAGWHALAETIPFSSLPGTAAKAISTPGHAVERRMGRDCDRNRLCIRVLRLDLNGHLATEATADQGPSNPTTRCQQTGN
jgi:hypothetical protein